MKIKYYYFLFSILLVFIIYPLNSFCQQRDIQDDIPAYCFDIYKQIHQHPELGKKEFETSKLILSELKKIGYTDFYTVPNLPTCIITVLDTKKEGPIIALRCELDARPGKENTGLPYSSKIDSFVHSCGHDLHASILLGACKLLNQIKDSLTGKVYFIFQPAEEIKGGADDIVNSGIIDSLKIQRIFALHASNGLPVGVISICPGYIMAGSNYFTINISGKSSHAATPYLGDNIPLFTSELVLDLSAIPNRYMDVSLRPCVISTTYINTGKDNALNVLPSDAMIKGTIRAYEPIDITTATDQLSIKNLIDSLLYRKCNPNGINYILKIEKGSPPSKNDEILYNLIIPRLSKEFTGKVETTIYKSMYAEDFAYYTEKVPCLYFGLGIAKDNLGYANVHSNEFSIHPDCIAYGLELFVDLVKIQNKIN